MIRAWCMDFNVRKARGMEPGKYSVNDGDCCLSPLQNYQEAKQIVVITLNSLEVTKHLGLSEHRVRAWGLWCWGIHMLWCSDQCWERSKLLSHEDCGRGWVQAQGPVRTAFLQLLGELKKNVFKISRWYYINILLKKVCESRDFPLRSYWVFGSI